jgi:cytochrome P450
MLPPGVADALANARAMHEDPVGFYARCQACHGDTFTIATPLGIIVMSGAPAAIAALFAAEDDVFGVFAPDTQLPFLGPASVFMLQGAAHREARRAMARLFQPRRIGDQGPEVLRIARRHLAAAPRGEVLEFLTLAHAISLEVIARLVFGATGEARVAEVAAATERFLHAIQPGIMYDPSQRRPGNPSWARFLAAREALDRLIAEEVGARQAARAGSDMLGALVEEGLASGAIRDALVTLLLAGHETTAISAAWAAHFVGRDAALAARLRAELAPVADEPAAIARLPLLDAVCAETLRLRPIGTEIPRLLRAPLRFGGHELPAGVVAAACATLLHARPELYPQPEAFRPERFLERRFAAHEYIPFGGGHRRCLGAAFGLLEMKLLLTALLTGPAFRLESSAPVPAVRRNLTRTLGPADGVRMLLEAA